MKSFRTLVAALALLTMTALSTGAHQKQAPQPNGGSAPAAPVLVIESFTHDFGEVKPGAPLRYTFKIRNEGKADLLINSVTPG